MAIENCEKEDFLIDAMEEYGILHVFAPAWIGKGGTLHLARYDSYFAVLVFLHLFGGDRL